MNTLKTLAKCTVLILLLASPTMQHSVKDRVHHLLVNQLPVALRLLLPLTLFLALNFIIFFKIKKISEKSKMLYAVIATVTLGFFMVTSEVIRIKNSGCYGMKIRSEDYKDMILSTDGFTSFGGFANENSGQSWRCFTAPHPKYGISGIIRTGDASQAKILQGKKSFLRKMLGVLNFKKNYGDQADVHYEGIHASSLSAPSRWSLKYLMGSNEVKGGIRGADGFFFSFKDWEMCKDSEGLLFNLHRVLMSGIAKIVFEMPDGLLRDEGIREVIENMGARENVQILDMRGGEILHRVLGNRKITRDLTKDDQIFVSDIPFLGSLIHHEVIQYNFKKGRNILWLLADEDTLEKFQFKKLQVLSYRLLNDPVLFPVFKQSKIGYLLSPFRFVYNVIRTVLNYLNPFSYFVNSKKDSSTGYNPHPLYETEYEKYKNLQINKMKQQKKWWQFWKSKSVQNEGVKEIPVHQSNYRESKNNVAIQSNSLTIIISTNSNKVLETLSKHPTFSDVFKFISCYERRSSKVTKFYQEKIVDMKSNDLKNVFVDRLDVEKEVDHMIEIMGVDFNALKTLVWSKQEFAKANEINKDILEKIKITKVSFLPQKQASFVLAYLATFIENLLKLKTSNYEVYRMLGLIAQRMAPGDVEKRNIWLEMSDIWEVLDIGLEMTEEAFRDEQRDGIVGGFNLKILEMGFEQNWLVRNNEKVRFKEDCIFWLFASGVME